MTGPTFTLSRGSTAVLVSLPHTGILIPDDLRPAFLANALTVEDTDWHLDALYAFARDLGIGLIVPRYSRYVIDLNRSPENELMYAGQNNTGLVPTRAFSGSALYHDGATPGSIEVARRLATYWRPYHEALAAELERIRAAHGFAILWDGHSIRSQLPWLFEGTLPDLNLGTARGASCSPTLATMLAQVLQVQRRFSHVVDGRFSGGYITRHYGRPRDGIHAVQLEMCWSCYMVEEPPFDVDSGRAAALSPVLRALLEAAIAWRPHV